MTIFNDQAADDALMARAARSVVFESDYDPGFAAGTARGLLTAPGALGARALYVGAEAAEGMRPIYEGIDRILGTTSSDYLTRFQGFTRGVARAATPRSWELGTAGSVVHGLAVGLPEFIGPAIAAAPAGPLGAAAAAAAYTTYTNKLMQEVELLEQGVDPATAARASSVHGLMTGLFAFAPGSIAAGMPFRSVAGAMAGEAAGQAALNVGLGYASRAAQASVLRDAGYPELAEQMGRYGIDELTIDAAIGLVLGPLAVRAHGYQREMLPATRSNDDALARTNVAHSAVDTRPGVPREFTDAEAHIETLVAAVDQLERGERVTVDATAAGAHFEVPPALAAERAAQAAEVEAAARELRAEGVQERVDTLGARAPDESLIVSPIDRSLPPEEKVARLIELSRENEPLVRDFIAAIDERFGTQSKGSHKAPENILAKSQRPSILAKKPWFSVEHVRDGYRFKTVLESVTDLPAIVDLVREQGWSIVKADVDKMLSPMEWGWRIASFDLRMPNGQLVEYYLPVREMEAAKKAGNHELFEKWRSRDQSTFTPADWEAFQRALALSNERYEKAWKDYLTRTGLDESALRASLEKAAAAASGARRNSSLSSSAVKAPGDHTPSMRLAAKPESSTITRPSSETEASGFTPGTSTEIVAQGGVEGQRTPPGKAAASPLVAAVYGGNSEVLVGESYKPVRWALVEATDLQPTIEKAENQPRDRTRAASAQQVAKMAAALDFRRLGESSTMQEGAPVLTQEGAIVAGNARTLAIQRAYELGTAADYRERLRAAAWRYGLTGEAVEGMQQPALVRVFQDAVDVRDAAIKSNEGGGQAMSLLEQAPVDAGRLPPLSDFTVPEDGNLNAPGNRDTIMAWVREFPGPQQAALVDASGALSQEGMIRLRNAVLYRAYGDSPTLARLVELTDPGVKNLATGLTKAGPPVAAGRDAIARGELHPLDIVPDVIAAAEKITQLRGEGTKVADFMAQGELLGDSMTPEARRLLAYFDANARSAKRMADAVAAYYARLEAAGNPKEGDMFGGGVPTKVALLERAIADVEAPVDPTLGLFQNHPDPFPGVVGAPRSKEQAMYRAGGRIEQAEKDAPAFEAAATCEAAA